jgi:tetratricopeptide (TPR) repeat protein
MSPRNVVRVSTFLVASGLCVQAAFAQGRGAPAAPPAGGSSTGAAGAGSTASPTRGTPTNIPSTPSNTNPQQQQPTISQPIFLSGRVLMEDGTPPTQSVVIERVCNGQPHSEGYTDSKGYFGIQLGQRNPAVLMDASEEPAFRGLGGESSSFPGSGGMRSSGDLQFMNCELRARLAGYRSQSVSLATRRAMDNPDVGVILLHRNGGNEGGTVSATTLNAPKDARKAYEKGLDQLKKKKVDEAIKEFEKAVQIYPKYAAAWSDLGRLQASKDDFDSARKSFATSIEADPKFVPPYIELSILEMRGQQWQALADTTATAVKLDPFGYPQAFFFNAIANYNLKNYEAAEKSAAEAERLDTRHVFPKSTHLLGILMANRQDYAGAAAKFKAYLKLSPAGSDAALVKEQLEKVEQMSSGAVAKKQEPEK